MTGEKRVCRLWEKVFCINFCGGIEKIKAAVSFFGSSFYLPQNRQVKTYGYIPAKKQEILF